MNLSFSFIVAVFNRPHEVHELLQSFAHLDTYATYEIIIVEDGSSETCKTVVDAYRDKLPINYLFQTNQGPGRARNNGAKKAQFDYLIFLDSDVLLTKDYLTHVIKSLKKKRVDCFGGPDQDQKDFSITQKAVDFSMTSFLTTGGIRGKTKSAKDYEPRSFNLGIKRELYMKIDGFSNIHPGEDPELIMRLKEHDKGIKIGFIPSAKVIHKRRISIAKFASQLYKFGLVRPIITSWHPQFDHLTFYFPALFSIGFLISITLLFLGYNYFMMIYILYSVLLFIECLYKKRNILVALLSVYTSYIQFFSYGLGFINSYIQILILSKQPLNVYPQLFFSKK